MASPVRYSVVKKLLKDAGWTETRIRGSHHIFTRPGAQNVIVPVLRGKVMPAYVRHIKKIIEEDREQGE